MSIRIVGQSSTLPLPSIVMSLRVDINIWFNTFFADQRYRAIAQLLSRDMPDVMVFQEVTPAPLAFFLAQPWIREHYRCAAVTGGDLGNYGMLMLSRFNSPCHVYPAHNPSGTRIPTSRTDQRQPTGYLRSPS